MTTKPSNNWLAQEVAALEECANEAGIINPAKYNARRARLLIEADMIRERLERHQSALRHAQSEAEKQGAAAGIKLHSRQLVVLQERIEASA